MDAVDSLKTLASFSQGGYLLIRRGLKRHRLDTEWRVSFRHGHRQYTTTAPDLPTALDRATARLFTLLNAEGWTRPIRKGRGVRVLSTEAATS
jgi:hypothetical protein